MTVRPELVQKRDRRHRFSAGASSSMEAMLARVEKAVVSAGQANGAQVRTEVAARMVAATPNLLVGEAIRQALGAEAWSPPVVTAGAEDFHHYSSSKLGLAATKIGLGCGLRPACIIRRCSFAWKFCGRVSLRRRLLLYFYSTRRNSRLD